MVSTSVICPEEVPSFDNSAMDGFALFSQDTQTAHQNSARLAVHGLLAAGDLANITHLEASHARRAIEIMTGAAVPAGGYDAVVRIEDVTVERDARGKAEYIVLNKEVQQGSNIRLKGSDLSIGQVLVEHGSKVQPEHILACASVGVTSIPVFKKPRVAIVSTGSELVDARQVHIRTGTIRNSSAPFLSASLLKMGVEPVYFGIIPDDKLSYRLFLQRIMEEHFDMIISTGAVSVGQFDFVAEVLKELNARTHFHKVAIRPGKPILFAEIPKSSGHLVFWGLPGNPAATAVGLRFFVEPYIRALYQLPAENPIPTYLKDSIHLPAQFHCFLKGQSKMIDGQLEAIPLSGQSSYMVGSLAAANCWISASEQPTLRNSRRIDIYPLHHSFEKHVIS